MKVGGVRLLIGFLSLVFIISCGKKKEDTRPIDSGALRPTDVKTTIVDVKNIKDIYTLPGVAEAWEVVSVPSETPGPVSWVGKAEGNKVKAGEAILRINTESLTASLNNAKTQLQANRKNFSRMENLYKQEAVSKKSFEDSEDALSVSQVNYDLALEQFNKSVIKSPIAGVIDSVVPKKGEYVNPGSIVAKVVDLSKIKIYVEVPEKDAQFLTIGQEVDVYPADITETLQKIKGKINFISVNSNPKTLTYKIRIDLENQTAIAPGRIVRADIVRRDLKGVILVDIYSVLDTNGQKYVFVNNAGKAAAKKIELGPLIGSEAVIYSGLSKGEELITSGQQFLTDGAPIRVAE